MGREDIQLAMKKILVITDFDSSGSGYRNICAPLFTEICKSDYDVKIIGLANRRRNITTRSPLFLLKAWKKSMRLVPI